MSRSTIVERTRLARFVPPGAANCISSSASIEYGSRPVIANAVRSADAAAT